MNGRLQKMIQDILGIQPDKVNIIPNTIPLETQIEYFETSKKVKENISYDTVLQNADWLFHSDISIPDKKWLLAQLASISKPEAYRIIEKYLQNPDQELADWARLAFIESRTLLESEFLNENQIIISSGLGGEENLLRYFVVFKILNNDVNEGQLKLLEFDIHSIIETVQGKVEEINIQYPFVSMLVLLNINTELKEIFTKIINTSQEYQLNLHKKFIITNVKKLNRKEIQHFFDGTEQE
ncbi:MAG: hypothetical protein N2449_04970 [Bacteroidales bacterium]|nr:hypothetical protein [Bacteroidales bacterium]